MASQPDFLAAAFGGAGNGDNSKQRVPPAATTKMLPAPKGSSSAGGPPAPQSETAMRRAYRDLSFNKSNVEATKANAMNAAVTLGAAGVSSALEGWFGSERMMMGGIDLRAAGGIGLIGYGLFQSLQGARGGNELTQAGLGVLMPWVVNQSRNMAADMARRQGKTITLSGDDYRRQDDLVRVPPLGDLAGLPPGAVHHPSQAALAWHQQQAQQQGQQQGQQQAQQGQQSRTAGFMAGSAQTGVYQGQHAFGGELNTNVAVGITPASSPSHPSMKMSSTSEELAGGRREITLPVPPQNSGVEPDKQKAVAATTKGEWRRVGKLLPMSLDDE